MGENEERAVTLWDLLGEVPDHREAQGRRYPLQALLAIALAAALAGRTSLAATARWGRRLKRKALRAFGVERKRGPCQSTWHYVFRSLDTEALEHVLAVWVGSLADADEARHVALDGKTLRGSRSGDYPGVHLLAAYSAQAQGVLGQRPVKGDQNEVGAALELLKKVPLQGVLVTGDAIFTHRGLCDHIVQEGGDYLFTVKDNQPQLKQDLEAAFAAGVSPLRAAVS